MITATPLVLLFQLYLFSQIRNHKSIIMLELLVLFQINLIEKKSIKCWTIRSVINLPDLMLRICRPGRDILYFLHVSFFCVVLMLIWYYTPYYTGHTCAEAEL